MDKSFISDDIYSPGDKICYANNAKSGDGTCVRDDGFIYATLLGKVKLEHPDKQLESSDGKSNTLPTISIITHSDSSVIMPSIGSIVTAKIKNVNPRYAKCAIFAVNNVVVKDHFRGQINRKDIRETEKDKVEVYKSFRCGDVILARVISLGDSNSYLLSTAENELGVVIAYSDSGSQMMPISFNEMQCQVTKLKEYRKVAKVQPEYIKYLSKEDILEEESNEITDE